MTELTQAMIEFLAWFLVPFAVFLSVEWIISLFRRD